MILSDTTLPLMENIAERDDEIAFECLFNLFFPKLLPFAQVILKNRPEAEEVVEDVFIKLWENRRTLPGIKNLNFYLFIAVRNKAFDCLEKNKKEGNRMP